MTQLKLAIIGDPHVAVPRAPGDPLLEIDPGRKLHGLSVELLDAVVAAVNAEPGIDAALVLGDLTRDSELFNHSVAKDVLQRLAPPVYTVLGNHDLLRERPAGTAYDDGQRLDRDETIEFYGDLGFPNGLSRYVVELPGDVVLIVLDSNRSLAQLGQEGEPVARQEDGWLGPQQLAWLDGVLEQITAAGRMPLVAMHHSLLEQSPAERPGHLLHSAFRGWRLIDAAAATEVLVRHKVPLVLSGHLHVQSVNSANGITNLVTAASVSYPHAWRLLTITDQAIYAETRRIASIPSCSGLQEQSREWMAQGMGQMIKSRLQNIPLVSGMAQELMEFVVSSDWWPRFCDGSLAGFKIEQGDIPRANPIAGMVFGQVAGVLSEYGVWKAQRPDPNTIELPRR